MLIGYIPGKTSTISTTVYQFWRTNDSKNALIWVLINVAISAVVLIIVNIIEKKDTNKKKGDINELIRQD